MTEEMTEAGELRLELRRVRHDLENVTQERDTLRDELRRKPTVRLCDCLVRDAGLHRLGCPNRPMTVQVAPPEVRTKVDVVTDAPLPLVMETVEKVVAKWRRTLDWLAER